MERQTQVTPKAAGEARDFTIGNISAGQWRNIHDELEIVAGKEWASVKYDQTKDRLLRATYSCFPDRNNQLWPKETPRPQFYQWDLTHGPTEDIRAQFVGLANRIGKLLGCPQGTDPLDFTLYRLVLSLKENKSSYLYGADEDGGIILNVCEALMAFCSRLAAESEAAEPTAAPQPTEGYPGETTGHKDAKPATEPPREESKERGPKEYVVPTAGVTLRKRKPPKKAGAHTKRPEEKRAFDIVNGVKEKLPEFQRGFKILQELRRKHPGDPTRLKNELLSQKFEETVVKELMKPRTTALSACCRYVGGTKKYVGDKRISGKAVYNDWYVSH